MGVHPLERVTDLFLHQPIRQPTETSLLNLQARIKDVTQTLAKEIDG